MGARQKLNQIHATITLAIAGVIGAAAGSWMAFFIAVAVLITAAIYGGNIRPDKNWR